MTNKISKILSISLLVFIANASVASIKPMTIEYSPLSDKKKQKLKKFNNTDLSCSINLESILDKRQNKETVAHVGSGSLSVSNVDSFLDSIRQEMNSFTQANEAELNVTANAELIRLYTYPESMNINGVLALLVDFSVNGKTVKSEQYRGFYGKTNWANGDGEYMTAINDASHALIERYVATVKDVCADIQGD
jgi:hypothetical protein